MTFINETVLKVAAWAQNLGRDDEGQGLAEYGLILALVAILCVAALGTLQGGISKTLGDVGTKLGA